MFGLLPVSGTFSIGEGQITVAEAEAESAVDVAIPATSFASGNPKRDAHIHSADYLDAAQYSEIRFQSQSVKRSGDQVTVHGELTVHGVSRPTVLTLGTVEADGSRLTARATATVDRYAFGLTNGKGMTGRHIRVTLDVVAVR